jgi:site-specific DNA recombinase
VLLDVTDVALGHTTKMRWNDQGQWIYSEQIAHPPIVDDETFAQAQRLLAAKNARKVVRRPRTSPRAYVLRGVLFCGICHRLGAARRMQGSWNNGQPYYRCTFPTEYAQANHIRHPRAIYLREAEVIPELDTWLTKTLDPRHLPATLNALAAAQHREPPPEAASLREEIAPPATGSSTSTGPRWTPAVIPPWSASGSQKPRPASSPPKPACAPARPRAPALGRMSKQEIAAVVDALTGLMDVLRNADPADKADIYAALGLRMTYHPGPGPRIVTVSVEPGRSCTKGSSCPRSESPLTYMPAITCDLALGGQR